MADYHQFLRSKRFVATPAGISAPPTLSAKLFPFQRDIASWAPVFAGLMGYTT